MSKMSLDSVIASFLDVAGNDPGDRIHAVKLLVKAMTGCRETAVLVGEAMQPWRENATCENS